MKSICFFGSGLLIGALLFNIFKSTETIIEERGISLHKDYVEEKTEKGTKCYTITKWGRGEVEEREYTKKMQTFLNKKYQLRFLDVDPDEYKLISYNKMEKLSHFKETLIFNSTEKSSEGTQFKYDITCDYMTDREKLKCRAKGQVLRRGYSYWLITIPAIISVATYLAQKYNFINLFN